MFVTKIKLFSVASANFEFIENVKFLHYLDYRHHQNCDESWYCIECCSKIFPLNSWSSIKNIQACCTSTDSNTIQWKDLENDHGSSLSLKPFSNLELLVNQFNIATSENSNDPEKIYLSKFYDIEEMHNIEIPHKNKSLSLFHKNACSLNKNFWCPSAYLELHYKNLF